jgi:superfamily II helicase|tara:strand:+ start:349 stop:591 length:243 start_codon:yes stop_codon:yes gene_type:complete
MTEQINYVGFIQQLIRDGIVHLNTHVAEINKNLKSKYNIDLGGKELQKWLNRIVRKKLYGYEDIKQMKGFHYNPNPNSKR